MNRTPPGNESAYPTHNGKAGKTSIQKKTAGRVYIYWVVVATQIFLEFSHRNLGSQEGRHLQIDFERVGNIRMRCGQRSAGSLTVSRWNFT